MGISPIDEVFYLSSKFNIRVIWLTYVLHLVCGYFAQCNHRFVILGSVYRPFFEGFKGVWPKKTREREGRLRGTSKVALKEKKRQKKRKNKR